MGCWILELAVRLYLNPLKEKEYYILQIKANKITMLGFIYKIYSDETELVYYGSTENSLNARLSEHKKSIYNKHTCSSKLIIESGEAKIELVECLEYENKDDLKFRERYYIENFPCVNINCPIRTKEEWKEIKRIYQQENKEEIKIYKKEHYQENKNKIIEKQKIYNEENKEKIYKQKKVYREANSKDIKKKKKIYSSRPEIKIKESERGRKWREENKDYIKKKKAEKKECVACKKMVSSNHMSRHKREACKGVVFVMKTPESNNLANRIKEPCPKCGKLLNKSSITRHLKTCPSNQSS